MSKPSASEMAELQKAMLHRTENAVENVRNKRAFTAAASRYDFAHAAALEAENKRLRDALEKIANMKPFNDASGIWAVQQAREALTPAKEAAKSE